MRTDEQTRLDAAFGKSIEALNSWRNDPAKAEEPKVKWSNPEFRRDVVTLAEVEAAMEGETLTDAQRKAVIDTILARYPGSIDRESLEGHTNTYLLARYKSIRRAEIAEGFIEEKTLKKEQAQAKARAEQEAAENADSYKRGVARLNAWRGVKADVAPADADAYQLSVASLNAWRNK